MVHCEKVAEEGDKSMRRSKLELYLDILRVLRHGKPMNPTQIMYEVNVAYIFLERFLSFLTEHSLVDRVSDGNRVKYVIAQKGLAILHCYGELVQLIPLVGEIGRDTAL